ncbi:MAG: hypothetical protein JWO33_2265, partial [Caulobacteraceae bacterium]|nr:hypothetical protein [Caulobacteraceae bacterium]
MTMDVTKLNRRAFVASAAFATGLLPARASLLAPAAPPPARTEPEALLAEPPVIRSRNGVLDATITAAPGKVSLGKINFDGELYNGAYLAPLLRARTGDVMRIRLQNRLPQHPTNLHFHGMSVSPNGASDNVFIQVDAGKDFQYEVPIPAHGRQGPGLYWYHPHAHGYVWEQLSGGMSGGLVVDGFEECYPIVKDVPERFLLIKNREHHELDVFPVNGQMNPAVAMRPGQVEFWRIGNINPTEFIKIGIEDTPFYVLATDGHPLTRPQRQTQLFLGPGQRVEALVIGPPPGQYAVSTIAFPNEAWDPIQPGARI